VRLEIDKLAKRMEALSYHLTYDESVVDYVFNLAKEEKEFGARPILRIIQNKIEDFITDLILINDYEKNHVFNLTIRNASITI
jgi:ATP-dependent Clp protease ATP-binding subunit ClpA